MPPAMLLSVIAGAILFFTYLVLAVGRAPFLRIDRTGAAIVGATLMIAAGVISLDEAYAHIDFRTLVLLFGMMVIVAHLRMARFFAATVRWIGARVHGPIALLVAVVFVSGALSALFVNDTICLVFTPVLIQLAVAHGHRPLPYLLGLATGSNIGSVATITGNPQNMLIGSLSHISYARFSQALGPVALFGLTIDAVILVLLFKGELRPTPLVHDPPRQRSVHRAMTIEGLIIAAAVVAGFLAGKEPALCAAVGAAAVLITRRVHPHKIYRQIDWDLLVLFIGLFVVIAGVERVGLSRRLFEILAPIGLQTVAGLTLVTAIVSNVISNVPAVMLLARVVPQLPDADSAWLTLAMASTLAGNLTLVGSIANLIVLQGARQHEVDIGFWEYCKVGIPVTLLTLLFGAWWLSRA
jgi:Na+/H+ antiporter NhaD/arsenite permease-like protein